MSESTPKKQGIMYLATYARDLDIDKEQKEISSAIRGHGAIDVDVERANSAGDFSNIIQNKTPGPYVLHICGEGRENGAFEIPDLDDSDKLDLLEPAELAAFCENAEGVNCVILNFCYSSHPAERIAQHIQCVIGIDGYVERTAAVEFSKSFYGSLAKESSLNQSAIDRAFKKGEAAASPRTGDTDTYIIHTRPSEPEMQLIEPPEGSSVPYPCKCRGHFKQLQKGASMWAYVNATVEGKFYLVPINNHYPPGATEGNWEVELHIGPPEGDSDQYRIGVLMIEPESTSKLKLDSKKAVGADGFFALDDLPTGGQIFGDRAVKRK
ncbi:MAG: hypothetical protein WBC73_12695 [Phormidesmis sp.]